MTTVRGLNFDIGWNINDKNLVKANNATTKFKSKVIGTESNLKSMGQAGDKAGNKISRSFNKAKKTIGSGFKKLKDMRRELGMAAAVGTGLIAKSIKDASDLNESVNKFNVSFGESADSVRKWSKDFADSVGRGRNATLDWLGDSQDLISSFTDNRKEAAAMSKRLVKLGVDLSSFQNKDTDKVLSNLQSGLMGQTQALKSLGIGVTANQVKQEAYRAGIAKTGEELTRYQKMQATMNLMYKRSKNAIGDATNTHGSFSNQLKFAKGNLKDISSIIGQEYLPVGRSLITVTNKMFMAFKDNPKLAKFVALTGGGATAMLGLGAAIGTAGVVFPKLWGGLKTSYKGFKKLTSFIDTKAVKSFIRARWQTVKLGAKMTWLRTKELAGLAKQFVVTKTKAIASYIKGMVAAKWATAKAGAKMLWAKTKAVASFGWSLIKQGARSAYTFSASLIKNAIPAIGSFAMSLYSAAASAIPAIGSAIVGATTATWGFTTALLANPITWVVAGVAGLTYGLYKLATNWDVVKEKTLGFVTTAQEKFKGFISYVKQNPLKSLFRFAIPAVNLIKPLNWAYQKARGWLADHTGLELPEFKIPSVDKLFNKIKSKVQWLKDKLKFLDFGGSIKDGITKTKDKAVGAVEGMTQKVRNFLPFSPAKEGPLSDLDKTGPGLVNTITTGISKAKGGLSNTLSGLWSKFNPISKAKSKLPSITKSIKTNWGIDKPQLPSLNQVIDTAWNIAKPKMPGLNVDATDISFGLPKLSFGNQESSQTNVDNSTSQNINTENNQSKFNSIINQLIINIENQEDASVDDETKTRLRDELESIIYEAASAAGVV